MIIDSNDDNETVESRYLIERFFNILNDDHYRISDSFLYQIIFILDYSVQIILSGNPISLEMNI